MSNSYEPKWLRELVQFLPVRSQFMLSGNIRDPVMTGDSSRGAVILELLDALWSRLQPLGYQALLVWDPVDGLRAHPPIAGTDQAVRRVTEQPSLPIGMALRELGRVLRNVTSPPQPGDQLALVIDFASRIHEHDLSRQYIGTFLSTAEKAVLEARLLPGAEGGTSERYNPLIWLVNRQVDLPFWLASENERTRVLPIPLPDADTRRLAARVALGRRVDGRILDQFCHVAARLTDGMSLRGLQDVAVLARGGLESCREDLNEATRVLDTAIRAYRIGDGSLANPWRSETLRDSIAQAENGGENKRLANRVRGQKTAISRVLDVLKRTAIGLTGAQVRGSASRPRGILFFAGPTGVGKTETAKAIAEIVFGDDAAYKRFDMSEFSSEHSADRLIGAPPGYVGTDEGGELTNALRERPFRVLLFDEIEKANSKVLDKFLQILEDGRLTDGQGRTVYFSDALIVFTSNAGMTERDANGQTKYRVSPELCQSDPIEYERQVMAGVRNFFINEINPPRPELLNRIGENIIAFNFISQAVGKEILAGMIRTVQERTRQEHGIELGLERNALQTLEALCLDDLTMGGRGIGSQVEAKLVNPLARYLFDHPHSRRERLTVIGIVDHDKDGIYELEVE